MQNKISYITIYDSVLALFSILMLLAPKLIGLGFILIFIVIIFGLIKKQVITNWHPIAFLFILLYVTYAVYTIGTRHPDIAGKYLEYKLSFVLLPLLLAFQPKERMNYKIAIIGYLIGTALLLLFSYIHAINHYSEKGLSSFLASELSYIHHPTYSSVYLLFAVTLLIYIKKQRFKGVKWWWVLPSIVLLMITSVLFLSLAGILFLFLLIAGIIIYFIYQKWGWIWTVIGSILIPFILLFSVKTIPGIEGEWNGATWYANEYFKNPSQFVKERQYPMSGSETRLVMWTVAYQAVKNHPFGVGTGNVDEVLNDHLVKYKQNEFAKNNYNPHNQYLQTTLEIGIIGLVLLLSIVFLGCYQAIKTKNWLLLLMSLAFAFNNLFESMLQRQSGIVFFTFVLCLLAYYTPNKQQNNEAISSHTL